METRMVLFLSLSSLLAYARWSFALSKTSENDIVVSPSRFQPQNRVCQFGDWGHAF